jgi:hypothetical protein
VDEAEKKETKRGTLNAGNSRSCCSERPSTSFTGVSVFGRLNVVILAVWRYCMEEMKMCFVMSSVRLSMEGGLRYGENISQSDLFSVSDKITMFLYIIEPRSSNFQAPMYFEQNPAMECYGRHCLIDRSHSAQPCASGVFQRI